MNKEANNPGEKKTEDQVQLREGIDAALLDMPFEKAKQILLERATQRREEIARQSREAYDTTYPILDALDREHPFDQTKGLSNEQKRVIYDHLDNHGKDSNRFRDVQADLLSQVRALYQANEAAGKDMSDHDLLSVPYKKSALFTVGEIERLASFEQIQSKDLHNFDAGLYPVRESGTIKWFGSAPKIGHVCSIGPASDPLKKIVNPHVPLEGHPAPVTDKTTPGDRVWFAGVYRDPESGHILAFIHIEHWAAAHREKIGGGHGRFAMALSKDNGESFQWCGYILTPNVPFERWVAVPLIHLNMGLAGYVIRDGYFYLYYRDADAETNTGGLAVARAKVADVLAGAENREAATWNKYYHGQWNEPGLDGKFSPLNIPPHGYMHCAATYSSHLGKSILVTRLGKREGEPFGRILVSFSSDGIEWCDWQNVHCDLNLHDYPSIVAVGDDDTDVGQSFWINFMYGKKSSPEYGLYRVLVTLK